MKKQLIQIIVVFIVIFVGVRIREASQDIEIKDNNTVLVEGDTKKIDMGEFLSMYRTGAFASITVLDDNTLLQAKGIAQTIPKDNSMLNIPFLGADASKLTYKKYDLYETNKPSDTSLTDLGISFTGAIPVTIADPDDNMRSKLLIENIVPFLMFGVLIFFLLKFLAPKTGGGLPFGIKVGKVHNKKSDTDTKFTDVAGMEEAKQELAEIVDFLKNPEKYHEVGAVSPKGVLLHGLPGSGKTLLARAVAGEAHVPFLSASGSEFMEMLVGMGAAKVRELFNQAKASPTGAIIFIDEIDAIGKKRGGGQTGGHQEQEQTLNQILTEMDGFDQRTNVVVIAATNRPDILDPALLRSGRFDRKVMVSRPTLEERVEIFNYYLKNKKVDKDVTIASFAKRTTGLVGADIKNIINEASLKLARDGRKTITNVDFEYALEKVLMGPEKKIKSLITHEKKVVTYHELGHAMTAFELPNADPVEKISIVSRGNALGLTRMMPDEDKYLHSKAYFLDRLVSMLGGRAAEEVFFGIDNITTGASNDFERATQMVSDMVLKYGMDEKLGLVAYTSDDEYYQAFKPYSEKTGELIDATIKSYLDTAYTKSKAILKKYDKKMHAMATILFEREYLSKDEFDRLMKDDAYVATMLAETEKKNEKTAKDAAKIAKDEAKAAKADK